MNIISNISKLSGKGYPAFLFRSNISEKEGCKQNDKDSVGIVIRFKK